MKLTLILCAIIWHTAVFATEAKMNLTLLDKTDSEVNFNCKLDVPVTEPACVKVKITLLDASSKAKLTEYTESVAAAPQKKNNFNFNLSLKLGKENYLKYRMLTLKIATAKKNYFRAVTTTQNSLFISYPDGKTGKTDNLEVFKITAEKTGPISKNYTAAEISRNDVCRYAAKNIKRCPVFKNYNDLKLIISVENTHKTAAAKCYSVFYTKDKRKFIEKPESGRQRLKKKFKFLQQQKKRIEKLLRCKMATADDYDYIMLYYQATAKRFSRL